MRGGIHGHDHGPGPDHLHARQHGHDLRVLRTQGWRRRTAQPRCAHAPPDRPAAASLNTAEVGDLARRALCHGWRTTPA